VSKGAFDGPSTSGNVRIPHWQNTHVLARFHVIHIRRKKISNRELTVHQISNGLLKEKILTQVFLRSIEA
jgi:hypothetical protein